MKTYLFLIPLLFFSVGGLSKDSISLSAESIVVMEPLTKSLLYAKNPHLRLKPASTVKIMTALVLLKDFHPKKKIAVSRFASSMEPSKIYIREKEVYYAEDLLKAVLMSSGNDASVALAEGTAGSEKEFVYLMNKTAKDLGAKDTNFKNSNGLPAEGQYSSAYDMSLFVREAMKYKTFVDIMKIRELEIEELTTRRRIKLKNHNKSLWRERPYLIIGKTGYTKEARHCFAGFIHYNRWYKRIIVVLKNRRLWSDLEDIAVKAR